MFQNHKISVVNSGVDQITVLNPKCTFVHVRTLLFSNHIIIHRHESHSAQTCRSLSVLVYFSFYFCHKNVPQAGEEMDLIFIRFVF
jgi:hypothetical protein